MYDYKGAYDKAVYPGYYNQGIVVKAAIMRRKINWLHSNIRTGSG